MRDKKKLTETLVQQLDPQLGITVDDAITQWWFNLRASGGMRLTNAGYEAFTKLLKIEHYEFNLQPFDLNLKLVIEIDRKLQYPYYIATKKSMPTKIIFFGSKEAMLANLYGNIKQFIVNYSNIS